ncbi:MAG: hypothetical protein ABIA59_08340, partial [Candidatus Latescibacterota bacterium]
MSKVLGPRVSSAMLCTSIICLGAVLCFHPAAARAQSGDSLDKRIKNQEQELKQMKSELEQHRAKSKELAKKETSMVNRLSALEKDIMLSGKLLAELD